VIEGNGIIIRHNVAPCARYSLSLVVAASTLIQQAPPARRIAVSRRETTIAQIHDAMKAGRLTCRALVDAYLRRIHAYDQERTGAQCDRRDQS
jgi:hypothetical protein